MDKDVDRRPEDETDEEKTNRREFLSRAAMAGGGALAALTGLAAAAEAAETTGPMLRTTPRLQTGQMVQLLLPASVQQHVQAMDMLKEQGGELTRTSADWRPALSEAKLAPADQVAAVAITELSQRFAGLPDVGKQIATLFTILAAGMEDIKGIDPRAAGNGCGSGCGYGCMAGVTSGFVCGSNCSAPEDLMTRINEMGLRTGGVFCGNNCSQAGLKDLTIDMEGAALADVNFAGLNMIQVAASMRNAAQAYDQVFGR